MYGTVATYHNFKVFFYGVRSKKGNCLLTKAACVNRLLEMPIFLKISLAFSDSFETLQFTGGGQRPQFGGLLL